MVWIDMLADIVIQRLYILNFSRQMIAWLFTIKTLQLNDSDLETFFS